MFEFYFQSGEFLSQNSSSFWDGVLEFLKYLSPFIAIFITVTIQKYREIERKNDDKRRLYSLFKLFLDDIIRDLANQIVCINANIQVIENNIFTSQTMFFVPTENIERITHKMDLNQLFEFYNYAHNHSENSI